MCNPRVQIAGITFEKTPGALLADICPPPLHWRRRSPEQGRWAATWYNSSRRGRVAISFRAMLGATTGWTETGRSIPRGWSARGGGREIGKVFGEGVEGWGRRGVTGR